MDGMMPTCPHCGLMTPALAQPCWPPCVHYLAFLRAALADPETAEFAAVMLSLFDPGAKRVGIA